MASGDKEGRKMNEYEKEMIAIKLQELELRKAEIKKLDMINHSLEKIPKEIEYTKQ